MSSKSFLIENHALELFLRAILLDGRNINIAFIVSSLIAMILPGSSTKPTPLMLAILACYMIACKWGTFFDSASRARFNHGFYY